MAAKGKYTTVSIPIDLAEKAREQIKDTGFANLSDYVTYILREIVSTRKEWRQADGEADKERVKEKLKALGYL